MLIKVECGVIVLELLCWVKEFCVEGGKVEILSLGLSDIWEWFNICRVRCFKYWLYLIRLGLLEMVVSGIE